MANTPLELVESIILQFGPRRAGSEAEKNAQHHYSQELNEMCNTVETEPFSDALRAKFASLKIFCAVYYVALVLPYWSTTYALVLSSVNSVLFLFHFVFYKDWLDIFYPRITSHNVTGTIEPSGEVKQTIILSGHMDSTPEFLWWYYFRDWGVRMMILGSVAIAVLPLFYAGVELFSYNAWLSPGWFVFAFATVFTLSLFFVHGSTVVDGAQDNLSGIAVSYFAARNLVEDGKPKLKNTRLKVVSFGSEETGLKGSKAYEKKHREELNGNTRIINVDGILDINVMHIVDFEMFLFARHDQYLVDILGKAFESNGLQKKTGTIPVGATDASSFTRKGIPAVSIVGLDMNKLHPTYHTRRDTIEHLNNDTLTKMAKVIADAVVMMDREQK